MNWYDAESYSKWLDYVLRDVSFRIKQERDRKRRAIGRKTRLKFRRDRWA